MSRPGSCRNLYEMGNRSISLCFKASKFNTVFLSFLSSHVMCFTLPVFLPDEKLSSPSLQKLRDLVKSLFLSY